MTMSPPEGHRHLKVIFYLEPVRATTGCLSVLPGSHFLPYRERMEKYGEDILPLGKDVPGIYPIETDPGDLLVFNVKLYHSSIRRRRETTRRLYQLYTEA